MKKKGIQRQYSKRMQNGCNLDEYAERPQFCMFRSNIRIVFFWSHDINI